MTRPRAASPRRKGKTGRAAAKLSPMKNNSSGRRKRVANATSKLYTGVVRFDEIKRRREAAGLTKAECARRAGFKSQQHWYGMESGRSPNPRIDTLIVVAKVLGCKVRDLLNEGN